MLAVIAARVLPGLASQAALVIGAVVVAAAIGATRVYLGAHYYSDVVAGWALGALVFGDAARSSPWSSRYVRQNDREPAPAQRTPATGSRPWMRLKDLSVTEIALGVTGRRRLDRVRRSSSSCPSWALVRARCGSASPPSFLSLYIGAALLGVGIAAGIGVIALYLRFVDRVAPDAASAASTTAERPRPPALQSAR